ncbi:PREDICTED: protein shisa-6 homolog [Elephantulus edwardii]|uniref:protein shisa-6 homolog n=1 Tax=Elephantulus edwardii TaxID=28737 RepID=UPI0003F0DEA8|nr:PREDICTED: protein shisa-6 homolog [Elephantulus edwardii]
MYMKQDLLIKGEAEACTNPNSLFRNHAAWAQREVGHARRLESRREIWQRRQWGSWLAPSRFAVFAERVSYAVGTKSSKYSEKRETNQHPPPSRRPGAEALHRGAAGSQLLAPAPQPQPLQSQPGMVSESGHRAPRLAAGSQPASSRGASLRRECAAGPVPGSRLPSGARRAGPTRPDGTPPPLRAALRPAAAVAAAAAAPNAAVTYETCWGYYDVSGQYDKEFECNNSESGYLYCCGTCYYRFCCKKRHEKLDQRQCTNYQSPVWVQTPSTRVVSPGPENKYDPEKDKTNFTVYITCGVIAFVIVAGVFAKVSYDKAHRPPREMNIHRALADILRQQGPIPIAHCERETISAIDTSPKENTPVRSSSKNHYTPVRTAKQTPGHYGKDAYRSGGPDLHNFISSGFVTLGRGHSKGEHPYNHPILSSATQTPTHEKPRMNNILTSATEPYDLSFSRSFQNLAHLPPSYESAVKTNPSKYSSLKRLTDKEADEYYMRRRHLPDLAARGTLPLNVIQMSQQQQKPLPRERPRRPIRAMSQDRVLSPERRLPDDFGMPYDRILSDEQLLSTERLHSQDPLLSPERTAFPEQSLSRAISHTDVFVSTPVLDRYRMTKMHSHPSASNNSYATLGQSQTAAKRQAFASRRHNTVEQLHYIPGHHTCYSASKTEVTV